jgi:hypothetical protein|tara:strand:+ start:1276 stop:1863 length:588 start_codon:yes stop_codon:yes gene_type:complete
MKAETNAQRDYDYWLWENYYTLKQIKNFNNLLKKNCKIVEPRSAHATNIKGESLKNVKTFLIPLKKCGKYVDPILDHIYHTNNLNFSYNLFNEYSKMDCGNYNIYSSDTKASYDWHIDKSKNMLFDIKWTVLINLSEKKYDGGKFKIFNQGEYDIPGFKSGAMLMFKSHLNHRVTPVTEGERRSFTIFFCGSRWR